MTTSKIEMELIAQREIAWGQFELWQGRAMRAFRLRHRSEFSRLRAQLYIAAAKGYRNQWTNIVKILFALP